MRQRPQTEFTRAAMFAPDTFDAETNTIEVVLSTGADVQRAGYIERLPITNVDLSKTAGAPFLDAHNQGSARAVIGVIEKAWKAEGEIRARIKLSSAPEDAGIVGKIRDGILRAISIGYRILKVADSTNSKGERVRTALAWSIHESSIVPIGADAGAVTRNHPVKKTKTVRAPGLAGQFGVTLTLPADDTETDVEETVPTVAETRAEIRTIMTRAGATATQADALIDEGATVEQARAAAYELMTARTADAPRVRVLNPGTSPEQLLEHRSEGLAARVAGGKPSDGARPFAGFSLVEHARDMLEAAGVRTRGMNTETLLTRAMHTVSDFPELLTGMGARLLRPAYEAASSPLVALCRKMTANDFRTQTLLQLGEMPMLAKVPESGEIKSVTRGEAKESWTLDTYGSIFSLSRKALINDDLSAFADFASAAGQAAANTVAALIVTALTQSSGEGPVMGDGLRMFVAGHGNTGIGEIGLDSVSAARVDMLTQTGVGESLINVRPDTLVVPPSQLSLAEAFVAAIAPANVGDVNVFAGKLSVACEPRLEAVDPDAWYLAASNIPALILGGLSGNEGPQIASRDGFDVLGREFRVTLDVGVGPHDFRGWHRSSGQTG